MGEAELSFWPSELVQPAKWRQLLYNFTPTPLRVTFLDDIERPIETVFLSIPNDESVEVSDSHGQLCWGRAPQPVSITAPDSAVTVVFADVSFRGNAATRFLLGSNDRGKPEYWDDSAYDAAVTIHLISERFSEANDFYRACAGFKEAMLSEPSFREASESGGIGIVGAFWPSDAEGHFAVKQDQDNPNLWWGDNKKAMRYSEAIGDAQLVLVIVNEESWGGAGGVISEQPAWANTYGLKVGWAGMALHELGHCFGLVDEYFPTKAQEDDQKRSGKKVQLPKLPGNAPNVTTDKAKIWAIGTNGSFEGAFYRRHGFYRPSHDCRMRQTHTPFCEVCSAHIRSDISALID